MSLSKKNIRIKIGVLMTIFSFIVSPEELFAQTTTTVVADLPAQIEIWKDEAKVVAKQYRTLVTAQLLMNMMTYTADTLAYEAAVAIASGGNANDPLYDGRTPGVFFTDLAKGIAGEAIGTLNDQMQYGFFGSVLSNFDLCSPRMEITLSIQLGIQGVFDRPEPKCDFNEIVENWDGFVAGISDGLEDGEVFKNRLILTKLADAYDPQVNEFQVGVTIQNDVLNTALEQARIATIMHIKGSGFQGLTNVITGNVETPAAVLEDQFMTRFNDPDETRRQLGFSVLGSEEVMLSVGMHAASVFTNTLLSELTQKLYSGLFKFDTEFPDPFADITSINIANSESARDSYRSFLTAAPIQIDDFNILSEFAACPAANRGLYSCVMDASLLSAVARASSGVPMTVEEAVEEGLLKGSFPLIGSQDVARNQDPYCYTYGYCHTNLVKLRKARVLPVGWELAAESLNTGTPPTLQQVIDGFDDCNTAGERDTNHPWCKLIDPAWVLKYPETQCRMRGNGQLLVAAGVDSRAEECVDMPSCIYEDANGNCIGGYGYCVREENTWNFRGDACPVQFASCLTFEDPDGNNASLLRNSVDPGPCSESNAGCLWYDTQKEEQADGSYAWPTITNLAIRERTTEVYDERIYLTSAVTECDEEDGGCREVISRAGDLRLNILKNPGFEDDSNSDDIPDGWMAMDVSVVTDTTGIYARSGLAAVDAGSYRLYQPGVAVSQGTFYSAAYYARQQVMGGAATAKMRIAFAADDGSFVDLAGTSASDNCLFADTNGDGGNDAVTFSSVPAGTAYERTACTFTSPILASPAIRLVAEVSIEGDVYLDDVQVEQGEDSSAFAVGYSSASLDTMFVKVAPSYLGCTGSAADPAECAGYAAVCSENEIGCTAYSPTNGNPTITGIANELDVCPSICAGYDTYKQEPTLYEPIGEFPLYFIPQTAETCSLEAVGCSEFTNLATEEREYYTYLRSCVTPEQAEANIGGDKGEVFYTWEGSDSSGYQLREWQLLESNLSGADYTYGASGGVDPDPGVAPCSHWTAIDDSVTCFDGIDLDGDSVYDWDTAACDENADIYTNPDCREFYDTAGGIHYRLWSNTVTVDAACQAYRKTELAGATPLEREVNCEASGGYFDAVIGSCRYLGLAEESEECSDNDNGCRAYTGGRGRNSRIAFSENFEGGTVSKFEAESALFAGLSSESLAVGGSSMVLTDTVTTYTYNNSATCVLPGGCASEPGILGGSCLVAEGQTYCGTLANELFAGKTYTISFIAKGTGTMRVGFDLLPVNGAPEINIDLGTFTLNDGWTEISVGPMDTANLNAADFEAFGQGTAVVFEPSGTTYLDNLTIREGEDNLALIDNSWSTPAICDQAPTGAASSQYYLGCQEYTTQDGETAYLKSFSKLCSDEVVGCEAFFMTQESEDPYASVHNLRCNTLTGAAATTPTACYYKNTGATYDTNSQYLCTIGVGSTFCTFDYDGYTSPLLLAASPEVSHLSFARSSQVALADTDAFLVVNKEVICSVSAAGCTELGQPIFAQDRNSITGGTSVYRVIDPDEFSEVLCEQDELFCEAWTDGANTTYYFKDPVGQRCEYRTDVTILGGSYDGWFREGVEEFCYGTCSVGGNACSSKADCTEGALDLCNTQDPSYLIGGELSGLWRNGDAQFGGWAGVCAPEYSTCTEYFDPLDLEADEVYSEADGESYVFLDNDNLDENVLPASQRCDSQASLKEGCALFLDTGTSSRLYSASATEVASKNADEIYGQEPYSLVDLINCEAADTQIVTIGGETIDLCAQRCVYDRGRVLDITDGVTRSEKMEAEVVSGDEDIYTEAQEMAIFGTSCYKMRDCAPLESETGEMIKAYNCTTEVRVTPPELGEERAPIDRLENDTNRLLKVSRDRQCSEWLSCANYETVWDENSATFKTVCSDVELCSSYTALGDASFCDDWNFEDPEIVLDIEHYTSRDVSWYGDEYSGMSVPNIYPVQALTQANIAPPPSECDLRTALANGDVSQDTFDDFHGDACITVSDCGVVGYELQLTYDQACTPEDIEPDYRLALDAGKCDESVGDFYFGESCSVGVCENSGAACADSASCGVGDSCLVGGCYDIDATDFCAADVDCDEGDSCLSGSCATPGAVIAVEDFDLTDPTDACEPGETFIEDIQLKIGTCLNEHCLLTPTGSTFDFASAEKAECRLYPEETSPFSNEIVERWLNPSDPGSSPVEAPTWIDAVPYDARPGFEQTNVCNIGQDCTCSYKKVEFSQGSETRYYDADSDLPQTGVGLCIGGDMAGAYCEKTSSDCEDAGGTCSFASREETYFGMPGYCLERDSAININGDRDERACLTWLPIDQLKGQTNLFAKYLEAGFIDTANYCGEIHLYANIKAGDIRGCSAIRDEEGMGHGPAGVGEENSKYCKETVACPDGFFAIVGRARYGDTADKGAGTVADNCLKSETVFENHSCPFMCVPINSFHNDGSTCVKPNSEIIGGVGVTGVSIAGTEFIYQSDYAAFGDWYNTIYADCTYYGASVLANETETFDFPMSANHNDWADVDYSLQERTWITYPACSNLLAASDIDNGYNYAWTDRLWSESSYEVDVGGLSIERNAENAPFGKGLDLDFLASQNTGNDPTPLIVPSCTYEEVFVKWLALPADFSSLTCSVGSSGYKSALPPQALPFIDMEPTQSMPGVIFTFEDVGDIVARLQQLFAKPLDHAYTWLSQESEAVIGGDPLGDYITDSVGDVNVEYDWDVRGSEGNPPKVWSLDMNNCSGTQCAENEEGALTINTQDGGNILADKFYRANLKFYAAADKNQLPIRRIIVDWGDANPDDPQSSMTGSDATDNFYKNYRGLQNGSTLSRCELNTEWGLTDDTCDPNYLSYNHIYACDAMVTNDPAIPDCSVADTDGDGILNESPCINNKGTPEASCSFQPRVHVRDNWGWCTGVCDPGLDGQEGCFEGDVNSLISPSSFDSECSYQRYDDYDGSISPWVYYDGVITISRE